jgi:TonB family protein
MKGRNALAAIFLVVTFGATAGLAARQEQATDPLAKAKALYESAEYDQALALMQGVDSATITDDQAQGLALYEALCLLALDHKTDAEKSIEHVMLADPLFRAADDSPPRLRALVDNVRARMRPVLARQHYEVGKMLFAAEDHAGALKEFTLVMQLTDAPGVLTATLSDIRTLASGFHDLSSRTLESSKPAPAPAVAPPLTGETDTAFTPPVALSQKAPAWPRTFGTNNARLRLGRSATALLDLLIDAEGNVQSVKIIQPIDPMYDALLLEAATQWKYHPATRDGQPIRYMERVAVNVTLK